MAIDTVAHIFVPHSSANVDGFNHQIPQARIADDTVSRPRRPIYSVPSPLFNSRAFFITILYSALAYAIHGYPLNQSQVAQRPDFVCNDGTSHQCVCNRSSGDLDYLEKPCENLIDVSPICKFSTKSRGKR